MYLLHLIHIYQGENGLGQEARSSSLWCASACILGNGCRWGWCGCGLDVCVCVCVYKHIYTYIHLYDISMSYIWNVYVYTGQEGVSLSLSLCLSLCLRRSVLHIHIRCICPVYEVCMYRAKGCLSLPVSGCHKYIYSYICICVYIYISLSLSLSNCLWLSYINICIYMYIYAHDTDMYITGWLRHTVSVPHLLQSHCLYLSLATGTLSLYIHA